MSNDTNHLRVIEGQGRAPSVPPPDPLIGRTVGDRYLIEGVLGEGGMGLVYRARHNVLNKLLAVKVLRPDVSTDEEIITRFRQEAQSASAIGNEHIIDITDFGTLPTGATYFVMEYLDGQDLTGAIETSRPMPATRTIHIAKQLCRALGAAHEQGIVHRDLKPDNIFLVRRSGDHDFVKVLDFGIAKVGGGTKKLTKAGQVFGTPHYMSPEQCAGTAVDHRTDIYALGVILYEMTAGQVPFDADNLMGILTKHMYETPLPPHELPPPVDVPPGLEAIILKCLAKKPEQRYQSMGELGEDLERAAAGSTPNAVVDGLERDSSAATGTRDATGQYPHEGHGPIALGVGGELPRRFPWALVAGGALLVVGAIAAAIAVVVGGNDDDTTTETPVAVVPTTPYQVGTGEEAAAGGTNEATNAAAPAEGATEATEKVTIGSDPEGAEVWRGDALLGNTPLDIDRPASGEQVELTLRRAGHVQQSVRISSLTSDAVRISLEREARERRPRGVRRDPGSATAPAAPPTMAPRAGQSSEVLDPWAQ